MMRNAVHESPMVSLSRGDFEKGISKLAEKDYDKAERLFGSAVELLKSGYSVSSDASERTAILGAVYDEMAVLLDILHELSGDEVLVLTHMAGSPDGPVTFATGTQLPIADTAMNDFLSNLSRSIEGALQYLTSSPI